MDETGGLGGKLSVLLVQLPPGLAFDPEVAQTFFADLATRTPVRIVCEPRHPAWCEPDADALLARLKIARVAADPARVPAAARPGGWRGMTYIRLHGSPLMYRSSYNRDQLQEYARALVAERDRGA